MTHGPPVCGFSFKWLLYEWKSLSHVWLCDPMDYTLHPFSRGSSNPGIEPRSLPAEPQGKPKNTGVGSLTLLQWIFPTQKLNRGLLHCRWILYQLSYQGSPAIREASPIREAWSFNHWTVREVPLFTFFNVATRKFKIKCMAHIFALP